METEKLIWKEQQRQTVFSCPIFSVQNIESSSPDGTVGNFKVLQSAHWSLVIPLFDAQHFVMVRQWRHGMQALSLEFPGGVCNKGEDPLCAGLRELHEETGYYPHRMIRLGSFNPNPALMTNQVHIFLAEDLHADRQNLDTDEYLAVELVPIEEVRAGMGKTPYVHALMASALLLFLNTRNYTPPNPVSVCAQTEQSFLQRSAEKAP
ncbi:MAG: NUDIX hydrolase [Spirochaetaceae bacterium]|jgi:8-oxo-dGTP pyrophosphatase MutT (NUDIX family)|nr:NUDIX hydrolase [Spirochaetaceae bacterium]